MELLDTVLLIVDSLLAVDLFVCRIKVSECLYLTLI